ncbi:hypothetical protein [Prosthecobacter sp.]|uniref:hypothetical protein n=1 Tax=Prosthecobacter sp. TaxID=1965333 RepID=UPI002ABB5C42|nr:hypothetical protein [Prosthecobacter sp.]MDZ4405614.1 hypothetical protein [Prosthecobacter sp.]
MFISVHSIPNGQSSVNCRSITLHALADPFAQNGLLDFQSVNAAPFGCGIALDVPPFEPLNDWIKRGGMGAL